MKLSQKYDKLMDFIYDEFSISNTFKRYGKTPSVLIKQFQRVSDIRFGNIGAQQDAFRYLFEQGWIQPYLPSGNISRENVDFYSLIKPTRKGILYVEERRKSIPQRYWRDFYESTIAGLIRGLKK
jgi:hypothetical protein